MKRRHSSLVHCVRIGTGSDEFRNGCSLRGWLPTLGAGIGPGCSVQRLITKAVRRMNIGARLDQNAHDFSVVGSRRNVQRGVTRDDVAVDLTKKELLRFLTGRSFFEAGANQAG